MRGGFGAGRDTAAMCGAGQGRASFTGWRETRRAALGRARGDHRGVIAAGDERFARGVRQQQGREGGEPAAAGSGGAVLPPRVCEAGARDVHGSEPREPAGTAAGHATARVPRGYRVGQRDAVCEGFRENRHGAQGNFVGRARRAGAVRGARDRRPGTRATPQGSQRMGQYTGRGERWITLERGELVAVGRGRRWNTRRRRPGYEAQRRIARAPPPPGLRARPHQARGVDVRTQEQTTRDRAAAAHRERGGTEHEGRSVGEASRDG